MNIDQLYYELAKAYNQLTTAAIENYFAENICYASQNVLQELVGKDNVIHYLNNKFETIRTSSNPVFAELAVMKSQRDWTIQLTNISENEPCLLLSQNSPDNKGAILLITTDEHKLINRIDICTVVPHWSTAKGSGIYP